MSATDQEAQEIKAALKAATGQDNLTEAEWDAMVARQIKLLAGEEVKEEVKTEVKVEAGEVFLNQVAMIDWNYFSP